jgi:hypothetical protein
MTDPHGRAKTINSFPLVKGNATARKTAFARLFGMSPGAASVIPNMTLSYPGEFALLALLAPHAHIILTNGVRRAIGVRAG